MTIVTVSAGVACALLLLAGGLIAWNARTPVSHLRRIVRALRWGAGGLLLFGAASSWLGSTPFYGPLLIAAFGAVPLAHDRQYERWSGLLTVVGPLVLSALLLLAPSWFVVPTLDIPWMEWVAWVSAGSAMQALGSALVGLLKGERAGFEVVDAAYVFETALLGVWALAILVSVGTFGDDQLVLIGVIGAWTLWSAGRLLRDESEAGEGALTALAALAMIAVVLKG